MNVTESIKFDKLKEENESLKNKLAEKDKQLEIMNEQCDGAIRKILEQQLYKEDFKKIANTSFSSKGHTSFTTWELKDNSLYDKLPSKDVK